VTSTTSPGTEAEAGVAVTEGTNGPVPRHRTDGDKVLHVPGGLVLGGGPGTASALDALGVNQSGCAASSGTSYGVACVTTNVIGRCAQNISMGGVSISHVT
jgi:hypothetical protein